MSSRITLWYRFLMQHLAAVPSSVPALRRFARSLRPSATQLLVASLAVSLSGVAVFSEWDAPPPTFWQSLRPPLRPLLQYLGVSSAGASLGIRLYRRLYSNFHAGGVAVGIVPRSPRLIGRFSRWFWHLQKGELTRESINQPRRAGDETNGDASSM